jgi:PadR family transcriptional regulator PadR
MDLENKQSQMRKGVLEYCILCIIGKNECYASDIIDQMKEAKLIVVEGTLYPLLTRLKNAGLLNYKWEESKAGPPRKYYSLTEEGKTFLNALSGTWKELNNAVTNITTNQ